MYQISIPYFSGFGHTRRLAEAIEIGIKSSPDIEVHLIDIEHITTQDWEVLDASHGIIFGSPTYMGSMAGTFKHFLEKTSSFWVSQKWAHKIGAGFTIGTSPSGDKLSTIQGISLIAAQHGMIWVGLRCVGSRYTHDGKELNQDGSWHGLMARSHPDKNQLVCENDIRTAELFGQQVALAVKRWENPHNQDLKSTSSQVTLSNAKG